MQRIFSSACKLIHRSNSQQPIPSYSYPAHHSTQYQVFRLLLLLYHARTVGERSGEHLCRRHGEHDAFLAYHLASEIGAHPYLLTFVKLHRVLHLAELADHKIPRTGTVPDAIPSYFVSQQVVRASKRLVLEMELCLVKITHPFFFVEQYVTVAVDDDAHHLSDAQSITVLVFDEPGI
jgi:hypothetical protein